MEKIITALNEEYLIRPYTEKDEDKAASLWELAFEKSFPEEVWRWKYHTGPFQNKILLCCDKNERIIVLYGGIPYRANCNGAGMEISHLMDIMSHPDFRKTGLFVHTVNAFIEMICGPEPDRSRLLYGFPGKYHFDIGNKYLEYRRIGDGVGFLSGKVSEIRRIRGAGKGILRIADREQDFDSIWDRCASDYPFSVIRNTSFIRWRYFDHPAKEYEIYIFERDSGRSPSGYAALSFENGTVSVIDMILPNTEADAASFFSELSSISADRGFETIRTWLPFRHFLTPRALESGFSLHPEPTGIIPTARSFDPSLSFDWVCDHIYYTMGDGDIA